MKLCSVCKKNIATVYVSDQSTGSNEVKGLCIDCAKKMGIPVIDQLVEQTGMSPEDISKLTDEMKNMFDGMNMDDFSDNEFLSGMMKNMFPKDEDGADEDDIPLVDEPKAKSNEMDESEVKEKKKKGGFFKGKGKKKFLEKFGINLTEKAKDGQVDKIIGRNREIDRLVQILNRRTKNNPILIGEPGVGKTAIAEGLAVRIVEKQVPVKLYDCEIYLLDLTAIVAGTQFRGQFESRMKSIITEARDLGNVILVIDEVHNIVGAGEVQGGVMNASNILKPSLARGEIQIIGATTIEEYRKHIEKDAALERRFQPIMVEEPTVEESIEILKGIKNYYEDYHRVSIDESVIEAAVKMSARYISDRYLPDKAIDIIDEAGSRANLRNKGLVELASLKEELEKLSEEMEKFSKESDYEKVAELKVREINIEKSIEELENSSLEVELTSEDIATIIESWTKIPVKKITEEEAYKLLNLEKKLHKKIVGQDKAIQEISKAIRRNRSGFKKRKKPSSFIFVGPTGVGKTELVKSIASELFGSEDAMIRIDMSEYMEKHTVSKLIGAPPGYVGYDQGGQLTEKIRRRPYSVILLDEIEKAHSDIFNMLLQILDDGRLTDSQGRTVFFENAIIIMTSNAGSTDKTKSIGFGNSPREEMSNKANQKLREIFRPEFLNRIDEIVVFDHLTKNDLSEIVDLMIEEVNSESEDKAVSVSIDDLAKEFLIEKGYDQKYGARPMRRVIQKYIEDEIAEEFLKGNIKEGKAISFTVEDDNIVMI
ncbi:MAG: ATP-dependent Clp protease ATP-binding subunit [Firmicutes bacterium]|jgi:ATP-dependent Clp protease ATP-binding subunit ClpA|nr:ATP-dependent Clp protease ATP-binding subunit [Bacillota bacterium]